MHQLQLTCYRTPGMCLRPRVFKDKALQRQTVPEGHTCGTLRSTSLGWEGTAKAYHSAITFHNCQLQCLLIVAVMDSMANIQTEH